MKYRLKPERNEWWRWEWNRLRGEWRLAWEIAPPWDVIKWLREVLK